MNWINTLSPWQWVILAAIPPAILSLYFLKLRRRDVVVPSTMLWKKAIEDLHVNSIWQRLRNNLLLILQLLFMGLLILACLRPGWSGMNRIGERRIYIIDNSASMGAIDSAPTRLEVAKAKVRELIEDTASDDVGMVIAFSDRADVRQGFTSDKRRLIDAVESIQVTSHTTDAREALRAAAGLANPGRTSFEDNKDVQVADAVPATVYLVTDGAIGDLGDADYGKLKIEYVPVGVVDTPNLGIVGFAVERNEEQTDRLEAFARVI
ncbi:MAG: vWA domain-containing protein, partial [Planctomycetota bacterium]